MNWRFTAAICTYTVCIPWLPVLSNLMKSVALRGIPALVVSVVSAACLRCVDDLLSLLCMSCYHRWLNFVGCFSLSGFADAQFRQYQRLTKQYEPKLETYEKQKQEM